MWRSIHSFIGLWGVVLVTVLSLSGAVLSVYPIIDSFSVTSQDGPNTSVANFLSKLSPSITSIETLTRKSSGELIASYLDVNDESQQVILDVNTGAVAAPVSPPGQLYTFIKELHRSLVSGRDWASGFGFWRFDNVSFNNRWYYSSGYSHGWGQAALQRGKGAW